MLVFGSSARVLKPSGRTILFYDKKSLSFHNHKGIAVECLTIGLLAFCAPIFLFLQAVKVGWEKVQVLFFLLETIMRKHQQCFSIRRSCAYVIIHES